MESRFEMRSSRGDEDICGRSQNNELSKDRETARDVGEANSARMKFPSDPSHGMLAHQPGRPPTDYHKTNTQR